jgi:hypothetical protein
MLITNSQLKTLMAASCLKCEEVKSKLDALPVLQSACKKGESLYREASKRFYPPLESQNADAVITDIAMKCGVRIGSLSVSINDSYTTLTVYPYYDKSENWDNNEYSGISTVLLSITASGGRDNLSLFIDAICSINSIRISSFIWSVPEKGSPSNDALSDCSLNINLEMYMRRLL